MTHGTGAGLSPAPYQFAEAECPPGKVVVGGGGEIAGNESPAIILTGLQPRGFEGTKPARFIAHAAALEKDVGDWTIVAYALCVDEAAMQPYKIEETTSLTTTSVFQSRASRCRDGRVAYSAGVMPPKLDGTFGLQMVRTSGPLDIGRASVRATSNTVDGPWSIDTSVVCGPRKDGIKAYGSLGDGPFGGMSCPSGQQIHGAGGGLGLADGGKNWLRKLHPNREDPPRSMIVQMSLQGVDYQMSAFATCATITP